MWPTLPEAVRADVLAWLHPVMAARAMAADRALACLAHEGGLVASAYAWDQLELCGTALNLLERWGGAVSDEVG